MLDPNQSLEEERQTLEILVNSENSNRIREREKPFFDKMKGSSFTKKARSNSAFYIFKNHFESHPY